MVIRLKAFIPPVVISTVALVGLNILFGMGIGLVAGLPIPSLIRSVATGGMLEMAITTKVLAHAFPWSWPSISCETSSLSVSADWYYVVMCVAVRR